MNSQEINMWQQRIQRAQDLQNEKTEERRQIIKLYTGTFFGNPTQNSASDLSEVNFVYEFVDVAVGAIYARNPYIFCRSRSPKREAFAETMEKVINYYWKELRMKQKIIKAIIDGILQPPGFINIGYKLLLEKNRVINQIENEFPELKDLNKESKVMEEQGILDETIKDDDVFAEHIPSSNVLWPDGYHDIRSCPYLIVKEKIALTDLLANPSYKKCKYDLQAARLSSNTVQRPTPYKMNANPQMANQGYKADDELNIITLSHVWDKRKQQRFTLAQNFNQDTLFEKAWDYLIEGFGIYPLIFNEIPQTDEKANSYPLSDIVPMIPQLKELSYISSAMMRHRKRAGTLLLGKKGAIKETDATNIQKSSDIDLVLLDDITEANIKGFTPPALPQDFYDLRQLILQDLMRISGFQQLLFIDQKKQSATESMISREGTLIRQSRKKDIIEDFTVNVAIGLTGLIWQFIQDKNRIEEIIGEPVTEKMWPTLPEDRDEARKIIQKELMLEIESGSTSPPQDKAIERKQWENLAGIIKANFPGRFKEDVFLKQLLKKYDFRDIDSMVIGLDDEEIAAAQEENKLLLQGIAQIVTPNENHMLHLQVHSQAYQVQGMQITPQMDKHIIDHKTALERKFPDIKPQKGDNKIAPQTTTPDLRRQGTTAFPDIAGEINNIPGVGGEKGGRPV
jgi:hypothetical protein